MPCEGARLDVRITDPERGKVAGLSLEPVFFFKILLFKNKFKVFIFVLG